MCGIVGYIGKQKVVPLLVNGLKRLEYRGYDSAGIAVIGKDGLQLRRCVGKLRNLEGSIRLHPLKGAYGIGHTRWATHGRPSEENAHPHVDCKGETVVVHNGIIENYLELKKELAKKGHKFITETDTEVIAHLIEDHFRGNLEEAVREGFPRLKGAYALAIISTVDPNKIIAMKNGPPVVIGVGKEEYFIASDIPAFLHHTRDVIFLNDGELAVVTPDGVRVSTLKGDSVTKKPQRMTWDPIMAEKSGFKHFMLKEIYEQPRAVRDTIMGRASLDKGRVYLDQISIPPEELKSIEKVYIVACGTSWHAACVGKFMIEQLSKLPAEVDYGSEFRYRKPLVGSHTLTIVITQSGETADTLAALREARKKGSRVITICNVLGSMATRESDGVVYTHAGPEIGVASTKAFTSQLTALILLSLYLAQVRGTISQDECRYYIEQLNKIPHKIEQVLSKNAEIENLARQFYRTTDFLYLGRGPNYPIALEGALKLKEISYIHAEGYPAGEMKHGPIALIDGNMPVVALVAKDQVYEKMISNIEEVKARDGIVIAFAEEGDKEIEKKADHIFFIPSTIDLLKPILLAVPLQLLAYHIAVRRGCDVDQPRNLAKSVTVE
ncbi:glutamine--fructose-6-phosphate transaminase (isomerizing) [bacterium (candidate division B38) B3_B38]|nr:MAG: glutamine--fructose-6-phosphate transaminase (isomerizing) [bacterium (candidate division B38) B3_B38]